MNIDHLIEQLIHLKSCGVEKFSVIDADWNDCEIQSIWQKQKSDLAYLQIRVIEEK
jgi:hypothetical protein